MSRFRRLVFARAALRFVLIIGRSFHSGELSLVGVVHNVWRGIDPVHDGKFTSSVSEAVALRERFREVWPKNEGWSGVLDGLRGGPSSLVCCCCRGAESVVPVAVGLQRGIQGRGIGTFVVVFFLLTGSSSLYASTVRVTPAWILSAVGEAVKGSKFAPFKVCPDDHE